MQNSLSPLSPEQSIEAIATTLQKLADPLLSYLNAVTTQQNTYAANLPLEQVLEQSVIFPLLNDDAITDILINGKDEVYIATSNGLEKTDITFPDKKALFSLGNAIAESVSRPIDPKRPLVDARLNDGSRVNIIAPPMAVNGMTISIRKFSKKEITLDTLVEKAEMTQQMAAFLQMCAKARISLLISGGTGTGKTTLLNAISHYIPDNERIITIEDTAELRLQQPHVVKLETKEPSIIGQRQDEVNTSDLLRNSLRMRPDRIIVGEVRGNEAFDMIQAMNTGHDGSMATVHANTPRDAFARIENLLAPHMPNANIQSIRQQMISALNLIIQLKSNEDGTRIITHITEIVGMEGDIPTMQDIFSLKEGSDEQGNKRYIQQWTGIVPRQLRLAKLMHEDNLFVASI